VVVGPEKNPDTACFDFNASDAIKKGNTQQENIYFNIMKLLDATPRPRVEAFDALVKEHKYIHLTLQIFGI